MLNDDLTQWLARAGDGDEAARDQVVRALYDELRILARSASRNHRNDINTTTLVHDAYLRVFGPAPIEWGSRREFFAYVASAMRNLVIDHARRAGASKHGGDVEHVEAEGLQIVAPGNVTDLVAVDQALRSLAQLSSRMAQIVELHVFGGLEFTEIAACLGASERTVYREWNKARMLLPALMAHE